jgi:hypothetical protein
MNDNFVWIRSETVLINLDAVAYIKFGEDEQAAIQFQASGQVLPLEKGEAQKLHTLLKADFRKGQAPRVPGGSF